LIIELFNTRSATITGSIDIIEYHGNSGVKILPVGIIFAKIFMPTTNTTTALAAPNLPIALDAVKNIIELSNGKAINAIRVATIGSKLNRKCSPFENGRANIYTYHVVVNHKAANAGIIIALINLCFNGGTCTIILVIPKTTPTALISIPVINVKCGGLSNPSTPNVSCHRKSDGPATREIADPIINNLKDVKKDLVSRFLFLIKKAPPNPAVMVNNPIPV
jgi:hypothetical protein